jgi:hypothetical protein
MSGLPTLGAVNNLLVPLLPGTVSIKAGTPVPGGPKAPALIGIYTSDDGKLQAACVCTYALVSFCGAALAMIPAGIAKDGLNGQIQENIPENFREILNIFSRILNHPGAPHMSFKGLLTPAETGTPELTALLAKPAGHLDLEITVSNYGMGKLSILMAG